MSEPLIRGAVTALVTPFKDGEVDEKAFAALIERQIAAGIHGVVPVGTTGESATLTHEEHHRVVELCVKVCAGRIRVVAGAGSNSTREAISLVRHAKTVGADAALVVTPYYNRPSQEGLYQHYAAINEAVQMPIFVYNVPTRTSVDVANSTLERLSKLPNIVGVKDATANMARAAEQRLICGESWNMLSGDDGSALGYMAHGGHGCITVAGNVAPQGVAKFYNACLAGDWKTAQYWQDRLARLNAALFLDASPAPTKFALAELGLCSAETRLPIASCDETVKPAIVEAMREAGAL
jgi:4-hydroxy-tetrahydrodipicolinate synthase